MRLACRYYAENAQRLLADEIVETNASESYIRYQPIGPVLAIMPWNFPVLAGVSFCCTSAHGGQCRTSEACVERASVCARDRRLAAAVRDFLKECFRRC
jgi:succinate-semialdehyde dehydrogenase/glutarate-semialdehyde dehydrogenase